mgnify:CR=1 FL=1
MNLDDQRQYEEAATDDEAAAVRAEVEASTLDLHTAMPGIVLSFDKNKQTAVVQPAVQKFFRGKGFVEIKQVMDVPVQFPRGGGFVLTFPVAAGDECLLVFSERAIDHWFETGRTSPPSDTRTHSLSDGFAIVGVSSLSKVIQNFNDSAVELRSLNGAAKVQIGNGGAILIESPGNISIQPGSVVGIGTSPNTPVITNGVLLGSHPCPYTGSPHSASGSPSSKLVVGS